MSGRLIEIGDGFKLPTHRIHQVIDLWNRCPLEECLVVYYSMSGRLLYRVASRSFSELSREVLESRKTTTPLE